MLICYRLIWAIYNYYLIFVYIQINSKCSTNAIIKIYIVLRIGDEHQWNERAVQCANGMDKGAVEADGR